MAKCGVEGGVVFMGVAFHELPVRRSRWRLLQSRDFDVQGSAHCGYSVHGSLTSCRWITIAGTIARQQRCAQPSSRTPGSGCGTASTRRSGRAGSDAARSGVPGRGDHVDDGLGHPLVAAGVRVVAVRRQVVGLVLGVVGAFEGCAKGAGPERDQLRGRELLPAGRGPLLERVAPSSPR